MLSPPLSPPQLPRAAGAYARALLVPMRGRSAMRIPRDVVLAGPEAYETYLREHARQDWDTPVPDIAFTATIQRTPDGPFRLSVTLVNQTPQPDSDRGFLARGRHLRRRLRRDHRRCPRRAERVPRR